MIASRGKNRFSQVYCYFSHQSTTGNKKRVCPFVFFSIRAYISGTTSDLHQIFMHVYGYGSVVVWRLCEALCISGFVDDDIFVHGPHGSISIQFQRVTSMRRRTQANAPAASYWLRRHHRVLQ